MGHGKYFSYLDGPLIFFGIPGRATKQNPKFQVCLLNKKLTVKKLL